LGDRRINCRLCAQKTQLTPEGQIFYEAWLKDQQQTPDELQVIDRLLDLDQRLLEFVAPAFSAIGAPARRVLQLLRALLLLFIKNVRSENFLVNQELKNNLLYRWFVRLDNDETIDDSFRIGMVRLRARLASRLTHEQWQEFLTQTVILAQAQYQKRSITQSEMEAPSTAIETVSAKPRPDTGPPEVGNVTFDLTPAKARARILDERDKPKTQPLGESVTNQEPNKKSTAKPKVLPRSRGDLDAYWITKNRRGTAGRFVETTLGYEVGLYATQSQGLITGVRVREASQANKTQFIPWTKTYVKDWRLGPGELEISTDGEFSTGEILEYFEEKKYQLCAPVTEPHVAKGKLDHHYFTYLAEENLFVCHEGAELKRVGYDKKKKRTRYAAPAAACLNCPSANLCKGGKGPRKVSRSDYAEQFARAKERSKTDQHQDARWAQHVYGEGSFAHSNCNHGLDRARYYGLKRMLLQAYFTAVAMNLKKAFRFHQESSQTLAAGTGKLAPN
jgi:hypothetical protein